jgi:hypothetical protein
MRAHSTHGWCSRAASAFWVWSLAFVAGCASSPGGPPSLSPTAQTDGAPTSSRPNYITGAELQSAAAGSTLDAVRKLRPEFLRSSARAVTLGEPSRPSLYVNWTYYGDLSLLSAIPIAEIRNIAFLHPSEGRLRFGAACACAAGVLVVKTESQRY